MITNKEKLKSLLIQLLDKFVEVCEANGLRYYLAYGSALGAVRHQGLIPWDDDIDVVMPRGDYEKLQKLPQSVWGEEYQLASWRTHKNYRYHFLKVELTNTTVIELFDPIYVGGVYLDIFPLDVISDDEDEYNNEIDKIHEIEGKYWYLCGIKSCEMKDIYHFLKFRIKRYLYSKQDILEKWEKIATNYPQGTKYFADAHCRITRKLNMEWFGEGKKLLFERKYYVVPQDVDSFLRSCYGDYMQLPPEDQRGGHVFTFIDITHRLVDKELKDVMCSVRRKVSYQFNIKHEWNYIKSKLCKQLY